MDSGELTDVITRLEELAHPNENDLRHKTYVRYVNAFLSCFGNERAYLVGSTCEKMKLRWSYQGGDADFLLCSGILEIPVECIEQRSDTPCYVWIRADNLNPSICGQLILGKYLSADIVREVRPELFTILRAIYTHVTSPSDGIPGRKSRVTITGTPSKVGLVVKNYHNLKAEGLPEPKSGKRTSHDRSTQVSTLLRRRWFGVSINQSDAKMLRRVFKVLTMAKVPGTKGEKFGKFNKFTELLDAVMKRQPLNEDPDQDTSESMTTYKNNLDVDEDTETERKFKVTFTEKTSKDFVPALRIVGELKLMRSWRERVENSKWPGKATADEIYNTDIFLVARRAPKDPDDLNRDFCLSFNLAEMKLSESLSAVQRNVFLILKSYLNGYLEKKHKELELDIKLKTYHLKSAFFWVSERENATEWTQTDILCAVGKCLTYIFECINCKNLSHYFVESNLFANFEELDFDILKECIREIQLNAVKYIEVFFEQDKVKSGEDWLTEDEVGCIEQMKEDGGRIQNMDRLEDQLIDMVRGFNSSKRGSSGQAPIKEAILKVVDIFLADEREKKRQKDNQEKKGVTDEVRGAEGLGQNAKAAALFGAYLTGSEDPAVKTQRIKETATLMTGLASVFPGGSQILNQLGGQEGVQAVLERAADSTTDPGEELKLKIDRCLSCTDSEVEMLAQELKHELTAFFIREKGKNFFDD